MMKTRTVLVAILLSWIGGTANAQAPSPASAPDDASKGALEELKRSQAELRRIVEDQLRRIDEQQKRIEELERKPAPSPPPAVPPPAAGPAPAATVEDRLKKLEDQAATQGLDRPETLRGYWKDGFFLETADKAFKIQIGGRVYVDAAWLKAEREVESAPGVGDFEDGVEFRIVRPFVAGTLYEHVEFKLEYDFADGTPRVKDTYLGLVRLPVIGNLRVGHFKEPFSMDELTSDGRFTFMERSLPNALAPSRNIGAMMFDTAAGERMTWAVGVFRETDDAGRGVSEDGYDVTGRVTGLPWYEEEGRRLWHLGAGYSRRSPPHDVLRYRARPEAHLAPVLADTGTLRDVEAFDLVSVETAVVYGPVSAQAEWIRDGLHRRHGSDPVFGGYYVEATGFLTGESRPYKRSAGTFDRVRPRQNFLDGKGGTGAVSLSVRYSNLDLESEAISGGRMDNFTAGVNWYLNPMVRIMLNYVHSEAETPTGQDGGADMFMMRFQVDF